MNNKLYIALTLYITALIASNTIGIKAMALFDIRISVAVFYFPIVFLMTDVVGELYGKEIAKQFVRMGFIATVFFLACLFVSLAMPWVEGSEYLTDSYNTVYGVSVRVAVASLLAFVVASYQDVFSFFLSKKLFGEKYLWLRSLISNTWSQLLDTVIFMAIAFLGVYPLSVLIGMTVSWWLLKVAMGFCYTPLLYIGKKLLK